MGRDINSITWHGQDSLRFIDETRQLTAYKINGNTLLQFESKLNSAGETIKLDGDPQHAGVQFRASQQVADKTKAKTYYIRPDGIGKIGAYRNWSNRKDESETNKNHIDQAFSAMSFIVDDQRYTCCYVDHPANPKPARFSERGYGRFGSYFVAEVTPAQPLTVRYRFWVQAGPMTVEQGQQLVQDFVHPITVEAKVVDVRR